MAPGEVGQGGDDADQPVAQQLETFAHQDQIGVVGDVAAGGPQMDDPRRAGAGIAEGVDMGHHVVAQPALVRLGGGKVDAVDGRAQLGNLCRHDRQAEFGLGFGQRHPQPPPGAEFALRAPEAAHFGRGVAVDQWIVVGGVRIAHRENSCRRKDRRPAAARRLPCPVSASTAGRARPPALTKDRPPGPRVRSIAVGRR